MGAVQFERPEFPSGVCASNAVFTVSNNSLLKAPIALYGEERTPRLLQVKHGSLAILLISLEILVHTGPLFRIGGYATVSFFFV